MTWPNLITYLEDLADSVLTRGHDDLAEFLLDTRTDYIQGAVPLNVAQERADQARRMLA